MAKETIVTSCLESQRERKCLHLDETTRDSTLEDTKEHFPVIIHESSPNAHRKRFLALKTINSDSDSDYDDGFEVDVRRRGSNVSLSRFRSCPQLLAECDRKPQSYDLTSDDTYATYSPAPCEHITPVLHSASPLIRRRLHLDINGFSRSETPTPPSTPKSRRSFFSQKESPSTPGNGHSPTSTPRLWRRAQMPHSSVSRTSSVDSNPDSHKKDYHEVMPLIRVPLNEKTLHMFEHLSETLEPDLDTPFVTTIVHEDVAVKKQELESHDDDTRGKCERWLQSLNISTPDKVKSRSHIQLPPI